LGGGVIENLQQETRRRTWLWQQVIHCGNNFGVGRLLRVKCLRERVIWHTVD